MQQALSCVTRSAIQVSPGGYEESRPDSPPHALLLNRGKPVDLQGASRAQLHVQMEYAVVRSEDADRGRYKVSTRAYRYHVLTQDGTEALLFHWHPGGNSTQKRPHVHLGNSLLGRDAVISRKAHVPTGRVALESVIRFLVDEYQVVPLREDHEQILEACLLRFERWRTWSLTPPQ